MLSPVTVKGALSIPSRIYLGSDLARIGSENFPLRAPNHGPGMRSGSLGMGLSTAEDIIERSERVVAAGDGSGDNADDMGNLQDFEIGEQEGDGLVGTTPTTAQARAGLARSEAV